MRRSCFALIALGWACASFAEFDLLLTNRYLPKTIVESRFERIVPRSDGGFYALGDAGVDVLIAHCAPSGEIITTRRWDSPKALTEILRGAAVDSQDRLYLMIQDAGGDEYGSNYVVQYSPTLVLNWTQEAPRDSRLTVLPSGIHIRTSKGMGDYTAKFFNSAGIETNSLTFGDATVQIEDICAVPMESSARGFAFAGSKGGKAWVKRVTDTGAPVYETNLTTASDIRDIESDSTGIITGGGVFGNGNPPWFYRVSTTGVVTRAPIPDLPTYDHLNRLRVLDGDRAAVMVWNNTYEQVIRFNRHTFQIAHRSAYMQLRDFAENRLSNSIVAPGEDPVQPINGFINIHTGHTGYGTDSLMWTAETLKDGSAAIAGYKSYPEVVRGQVSTAVVGGDLGYEERLFDIQGYYSKPFLKSVVSGLGEVGILTASGGYPNHHILLVYGANGNLKFTKALLLKGEKVQSPVIYGLRDGSFLVTGRQHDTVERLVLMRFAANGNVMHAGKYAMKYASQAFSVTQPSVGNDVILGLNTTYTTTVPCVIARVTPAGAVVYSVGYGDKGGELLGTNGKILWAQGNGFGTATLIRRLNDATGLLEKSTTIDGWNLGLLDLAGSAFAIATQTSGTAKVRRLDETTLGITHQANFSNQSLSLPRVGAANRVAFLLRSVAGRRLWALNGADLTIAFPSKALPATVWEPTDLTITSGNQIYMTASEDLNGNTDDLNDQVYVAKWNADGSLAAERRLEKAQTGGVHSFGSFIWLTGQQRVRDNGAGPFISKYTR